MSAKKNLTVAALAALLAVPAFGATNTSHALHIPSVTAHADHYTGPWNVETYNRWKDVPGVVENQDGSGINQEIGGTIGADEDPDTNPNGDTTTKTQNGHTYVVAPYPQCPGKIISVDGQSVSSQAQILSILNNKNGQSGTQTTTTNKDSTNNSSANNGSTQYSSKKSLPQTGESNDASKAMAMGAVALGASASMMALSMAKKHRQESELDSVSSEPSVDDGDDKSNNNDADDIDAGYHMIMSDMFDNISKDLKQM